MKSDRNSSSSAKKGLHNVKNKSRNQNHCFYLLDFYSRVPNTTEVPNKSVGGHFFEIYQVKKGNVKVFICLLGERKNFQKLIKLFWNTTKRLPTFETGFNICLMGGFQKFKFHDGFLRAELNRAQDTARLAELAVLFGRQLF